MAASPTINEPASSEHILVFLPELGLAKIIDHIKHLTNPDRYVFTVVPTPAYKKLLGERATKDKRYVEREDCYIIEVPSEYVFVPKTQDPVFFRFGLLTNWEGQFIDISAGMMERLMNELQSVKRTRDWYAEALKLKDRQIAKMSAHPEAMEKEIINKYGKTLKEFNPISLPPDNAGGSQK